MNKEELLELNEVWGGAKVACHKMGKEATIKYLYAKIKVTSLAKKVQEELQEARKMVSEESGFSLDEKIPADKLPGVQAKLFGLLEKISAEKVDVETKILTEEELYDCVLSVEENKDISTNGKAALMKYLVKE